MLFSDRMREVFTPGPTGFIGAVDQLIDVARDWDLRLDWFDIEKGLCRIEASRGGEIHETYETVLDKGVFRAMLSRLAALCGDSVSPGRNRSSATSKGLLFRGFRHWHFSKKAISAPSKPDYLAKRESASPNLCANQSDFPEIFSRSKH